MTHRPSRFLRLLRLLALSLSLGAFASSSLAQRSEPREAQAAKAQPKKAEASTTAIDLNKATEADLARLPGIGPSKARAIVELRTRLKNFSRIEDLLRVKGIGRKTFRKLRPLIRVGSK